MRFVTCLDYNKLSELIDTNSLDNNLLFDLSSSLKSKICKLFEDLNGDFSSINIGLFIPNDYGSLSDIWKDVARFLPIKSGDAIFQFNINSDECLLFELNDFLPQIYNSNANIEELQIHQSHSICLSICDSIPSKSFDCAYIVNSSWGSSPLDSSLSGSLVSSISELNSSSVWRS